MYIFLCVNICFHFSWVNSGPQGRYTLNFINITRAFWMWLYHSPLPPIMYEGWVRSTFSSTFDFASLFFFFLINIRHSDSCNILKMTPVFLSYSFTGHRKCFILVKINSKIQTILWNQWFFFLFFLCSHMQDTTVLEVFCTKNNKGIRG